MPEMSKPVYLFAKDIGFPAYSKRCGGLLSDAGGTEKSFDARIMPLPLGDFSRMRSDAPRKAAFGRALSVDTRDYSF